MDYFTKRVKAYAAPDLSATTAAELLEESLCRFRAPEELHSDQGRKLEVFGEVCQWLGITKTHTTPLHLQSNQLVKRFHHSPTTQLAILVAEHQHDWDAHLPLVLLAYRRVTGKYQLPPSHLVLSC